MYDNISLAASGSTGNGTGTNCFVEGYDALAFQFVVEAAGATPTVTFKFQGSLDGVNWYDVAYVTDANDTTSTATKTVTATGASILFLDNPVARKYKFARVVVSANTNITYRAEAWRIA